MPITGNDDQANYEELVKQRVIREKNQIANSEKLKKAVEKFKQTHKQYREVAKQSRLPSLSKWDDLDQCVETCFRLQLYILNQGTDTGGIETACNHWKYRGKSFTEYLRSETFVEETLRFSTPGNLMIIIPEELKALLEKKVKKND